MTLSPSDHPQRRQLSDLLHERSLNLGPSPVVLRSWVVLVTDAERAAEADWIARWGTPQEAEAGRLARIELSEGQIVSGRIWERHGEFSTYLQFTHELKLAGDQVDVGIGLLRTKDFDWLAGAPGLRFRSVEILVRNSPPDQAMIELAIDVNGAVCCDAFDGAARIWTDFRLHNDHGGGGSGRMIIHDKALRNDELSRLVQTVLELGQYRKLALLGFPPAREVLVWIKDAEARLAAITTDLRSPDIADEDILRQLSDLSGDVEARMNHVRFRQGATQAYYRLTVDRLASLREERVEGYSTVAEFIQRRLQPALRTCEAAEKRLGDLAAHLGRPLDLLRTRISIAIEQQNQELLRGMDKRSSLQLRMQSLVEGLSVFAISYYLFNLVKYLMQPVQQRLGIDPARFDAAAVLVIVLVVWFIVHTRRRKIARGD